MLHSALPHVRRDVLDHRVLAENDHRTARAIGGVERGNIGCRREGALVVRRYDHANRCRPATRTKRTIRDLDGLRPPVLPARSFVRPMPRTRSLGRSRTVLIVLAGWFGLSVALCFTLATAARRLKILRMAEDNRLLQKRRVHRLQHDPGPLSNAIKARVERPSVGECEKQEHPQRGTQQPRQSSS
jgi:hypothetical protein